MCFIAFIVILLILLSMQMTVRLSRENCCYASSQYLAQFVLNLTKKKSDTENQITFMSQKSQTIILYWNNYIIFGFMQPFLRIEVF